MIELRHLRYFIAVAEELNFTRASERVHIDQTPLSRAVRDLEDALDVQLFVRGPRRLTLTPAGARLLQDARRIFIRLERTKRAVRQTHSLYRAPLRVGVADNIAQPMLSECFSRWRVTVPEVPLELTEMRARELAVALRHEDVDVGFSFGLPDDDAIAQQPAWRYRVMAMVPAGHELARQPVIPIRDLLAFPVLCLSEERMPGLFAQMRRIVERHVAEPTIAGVANTVFGYVTRIAMGDGVGIGDEGHLQTLKREDLVVRPLAEEEYITTCVLHKNQRFGVQEPVRRFLAHINTLS